MPVDTLVADPAFQALDVRQKREALSHFDPAFSRLTDDQVGEFTLKFQKPFDAGTAQDKLNAGNPRPGTLKGRTSIEQPRPMDDRIADMYPIIGGIGGEYAGGPVGAMVGGAAGETIKQIPNLMNAIRGQSPESRFPLAPNQNPSIVQQPPSALPETGIDTEALKSSLASIITEGLTQGGFSKGAKWLGNIGSELSASLKNHRSIERMMGNLPIEGDVADAAALESSGMPHTVSQKTGNSSLNWLEGAVAPKGERVALKNAQTKFIDEGLAKFRVRFGTTAGPGSKPYSDLAGMSQESVLKRQAAAKRSVGAAYDAFDAATTKDVITIPQIIEPERTVGTGVIDPITKKEATRIEPAVTKDLVIKQPIYIGKATNKFINEIKPELDTVVANLAQIPADAKSYQRLNKLKITLDNLQSGTTIDGIQVMPFKVVKQLRTDINDAIRDVSKLDRTGGALKALRGTLGTDAETSVAKFSNPKALGLLKLADAMHSEAETVFNPKVMKSIIKGQYDKVDPSQVFNEALANPDRARELVRALGPEDARLAKGHFFSALDAEAGSNPNEILNKLNSPSYREVFSAHEYKDLTDFFRAQRRVQEFSTDAGSQAGLIWRKAGVTVALAGGAGKVLSGGDSNIPNYALGGGLLMLGGRAFASRILLNPKYARAAGKLTRIAPSSSEASFLRRTILTGMRGAEGLIKYENGKTQRVKINANGEPVPIE